MHSRALLFDIGNVIVHFDFTTSAAKLAELSDASKETVLATLGPVKDALESGAMSDEDFITQGMKLIGFRGSRADFAAIWGDIFTANEPMMNLLRRLHGRVPLYLLSNTSGIHKDYLFEHFDVFRLFDGGTYSHEAKCMKPHEPIFQQAEKTWKLHPAHTFYIDDLADNIRTGERLGFVSHIYQAAEHDRLERALATWLAD